MTDLNGKTVFITGASRGIGAATARHFAASGANVTLVARSRDAINQLAEELGDNALAIALDVADYDAVAAAVQATKDRFGGLDILLNNAGVIEPIARIADSDPKAWQRVMDINVAGVYNGIRAVLPDMETAGAGTIINISSGAATYALEGWSHYCASKAAVLSLTACTHQEVGALGVTCVGLSPGTVATEMQVQIKQSGINPVSLLDPSDHISPDAVAKSIAFLCRNQSVAIRYAGTDFSLRSPEGHAAAGL